MKEIVSKKNKQYRHTANRCIETVALLVLLHHYVFLRGFGLYSIFESVFDWKAFFFSDVVGYMQVSACFAVVVFFSNPSQTTIWWGISIKELRMTRESVLKTKRERKKSGKVIEFPSDRMRIVANKSFGGRASSGTCCIMWCLFFLAVKSHLAKKRSWLKCWVSFRMKPKWCFQKCKCRWNATQKRETEKLWMLT